MYPIDTPEARGHHHSVRQPEAEGAGVEARFPSRRLTSLLIVVGAIGLLALLVLLVVSRLSGAVWCLPFVGAYLGGVVAVRRLPDHLAARRLLLFGTAATVFLASVTGLSRAFEELGRAWWLAPGNVGVQVLGLTMEAAMIALLAVYPNGRYQRRIERHVVVGAVAVAVTLPFLLLATHRTVYPSFAFSWDGEGAFPEIRSPVLIEPLTFLGGPLSILLEASVSLGPLVGASLMVVRYRRLGAEERAQVRWPTYGLLTLLLAPLALLLETLGVLSVEVTDWIAIIPLTLLPASVVVGLVKPDLFDVDEAMRRTLVFAPLWVAIAGAYIGVAAALGFVASGLGLQVTILVTILATVLFTPIRRRLIRRAATWAYGEPMSAAAMVRLLGDTLEHPRQPEQLAADIAATARQGLGVRWTRIQVDGSEPITDGSDAGPAYLTAAMVHGGELVGTIRCGPPVRGRAHPGDQERLETLASQAAVVIHNARLAAELRLRVDEIETQAAQLAASRTRLVAADETARRRIERDLHDGAQQDLVALIARIGLARAQLAGRTTGMPAEELDELRSGAQEALENLRQLAAGIHPTELADHGLLEAIEGRTARLPIDVVVECDEPTRTARFGDEVEGAAYFFVSEGLANALKHSGADRVRVCIARRSDELEVVVADDGTGFGSNGTPGTGLQGLADRMAAVGGSMSVDSTPGRGTRLTATLPLTGSDDA